MALPNSRVVADSDRQATLRSASSRSRLAALIIIYLVIGHVLPAPFGVTPAGWRTTAVVVSTIAGLMLQPFPGAVVILVGLCMVVLIGGVSTSRALSGFSSPSVWLIVPAMLMARALRDSSGRSAARRLVWLIP